ncbi:hypothetical protein [Maridesulfovibrio bastinii]|uniref:hypothetical protein n=1 Tax=Maridesulfovibrio bastinii TaxID=47157 RepID=UPI0012EC5E6B|nr:hypothetical protein [Maridesulfovibrio bastinii]
MECKSLHRLRKILPAKYGLAVLHCIGVGFGEPMPGGEICGQRPDATPAGWNLLFYDA